MTRRTVRPQDEPMLVNVCARAMTLGRGHDATCDACGRTGAFVGLVYHWSRPIENGGERDPFNISGRCGECWERTGRSDGLAVPEGAAIHKRHAPIVRSPIHVIEL